MATAQAYSAWPAGVPPGTDMRSVTPATNNTRNVPGRHASAPRMGGPAAVMPPNEPYASNRSLTPSRYMSGYDPIRDGNDGMMGGVNSADARGTPSSTGLIRLSLKKPMGIVFEPMYDPNQKSLQRGVRICDLPRTGAAALSRKLQVGDELLQINDKTVSRLNFDQIMDFIIEADPESVNLLFRRPRKETLQARQGVQQKLKAAANKDAPSTVKWVDEGQEPVGLNTKKDKKDRLKDDGKKSKSKSKRSKKGSVSEDEEETIQSSTAGDESYQKATDRRHRKKSKSKRDPYESESFLDLLIDTICANSNNVCRDGFRRTDDDYFSEEDEESFVTDAEDESTYMTYDESLEQRAKRNKKLTQMQQQQIDEEETEDGTRTTDNEEEDRRNSKHKPTHAHAHSHIHGHKKDHKIEKVESKEMLHKNMKYEDDGTLETAESDQRGKLEPPMIPAPPPPLGLAPPPPVVMEPPKPVPLPPPEPEEDTVNPAPIRELEYDDRIDHGADVSVMESLGGPSLLIEKQRAAAAQSQTPKNVPEEIMEKYGLDYPANFAMTREQTIQADPLKYYTYVVKGLLEEHEPEKVRLLDKLLAKYKGREDHLVQKLAVRYDRTQEMNENPSTAPSEHDEAAFTDAVQKNKSSSSAAAAVHTAKERMHISGPEREQQRFDEPEWPEKESKEPDIGDDEVDEEEEESESGSDYSRDSVDGTSPAVIAQVSELLNYVYGKTSVPGQIDRVSTIMRAYEGREAVLLELLETKALIKANKEKENADNLPSFLRNSQQMVQAHLKAGDVENSELPPVTPMATQPVTDDISSMSGVSSPAHERDSSGIVNSSYHAEEVEVMHTQTMDMPNDVSSSMISDTPNVSSTLSGRSSSKPPTTPDKKKKKGLFGGLFGKKNKSRDGPTTPMQRAGSRSRNRKLK